MTKSIINQKHIYYFQEKSNDILDLQDDFSIEEIGIYTILKATYFKYKGLLPIEKVYRLARYFDDKKKLSNLANKIFTQEEGFYKSAKWDLEISNITENSNKKRNASLARWEKGKTEAKQKQIPKIEIPDYLDKEKWDEFIKQRKILKAVNSKVALEMILKKLESYERQKEGNGSLALNNSIVNSYKGVFEPPKEKQEKRFSYSNKPERICHK